VLRDNTGAYQGIFTNCRKCRDQEVPQMPDSLKPSGLEPLVQFREQFHQHRRADQCGSSKVFARLIRDEKFEEALTVARQQVENGAQ
jgi:5-methyltetrahydrofolate--homocysteine methyltransferase